MSLTQLKELYKWSLLKYKQSRSGNDRKVCEDLKRIIEAMEI